MTKLTTYEYTPADIDGFIRSHLSSKLSLAWESNGKHNSPLDMTVKLGGQNLENVSNFIVTVREEIF